MIDPSNLQQEMLSLMRSNLMKLSSQAKPMVFQEILTKALSHGLIKTLKSQALMGISPAPVAVGTGVGYAIEPQQMSAVAKAHIVSQSKHSGTALDLILDSVFQSMASHLSKAQIVSSSGFGGQALPISVPPEVFHSAFLAEFPSDYLANIQKSESGLYFIMGLAKGTAAGVSSGVPGLVPFGSTPPPPGLLIAQIV